MQSVHFLTVGKLKESFYLSAKEEYVKRLGAYCKLRVLELPEEKLPQTPSPAEVQRALGKEGEKILEKIPPSAKVIALCVEGKTMDSPALSSLLSNAPQEGFKHLVFVIGGSYGLSSEVKARGDVKLSLSPMTFPHHLAQILLLEQIYRGFKIQEGSAYHK